MNDFNVSFMNNDSENNIHMCKNKKKTSDSFCSQKGADLFCKNRSYISTCKKRGVNAFKDAINGFLFIFHPTNTS